MQAQKRTVLHDTSHGESITTPAETVVRINRAKDFFGLRNGMTRRTSKSDVIVFQVVMQ